MDARKANDRIADKAEQLHFVSRVPMMCECSAPACRAVVMVSLEEYGQIREDPDSFLTAHDHQLDGAEPFKKTSNYTIQRSRRRNGEGNGDRRSA